MKMRIFSTVSLQCRAGVCPWYAHLVLIIALFPSLIVRYSPT